MDKGLGQRQRAAAVNAESSRARGAVPPRTAARRKRVGAWRRGVTAVLLLMALAVTLKTVRKHRTAECIKAAPSPSTAVTLAPLLASAPPPRPLAPSTAGAAALDEGHQARLEWIHRQMIRHGKDNPLAVMLPKRIEERPGRKEIMVWMEGDVLMLKSGKEVMRRRPEQLPPRMLAAIAAAIAQESRGTGPPSPAATP